MLYQIWRRAYQSSIRIFRHVSGKSDWHTFAAMLTLSKMQNPIGWLHSAWCPGGRITAMAFLTFREVTARQVSIAPPADSNAHPNVVTFRYIESNVLSKTTRSSNAIPNGDISCHDHHASLVLYELAVVTIKSQCFLSCTKQTSDSVTLRASIRRSGLGIKFPVFSKGSWTRPAIHSSL